MAKILNLDTFGSDAGRSITIKGKTYPVVEMSVENFIETTKAADRIAATNASEVEQIEETVAMIQRSIPDIDPAVLRQLEMVKLAIIVKFIRGEMDDQVEQAAQEAEAKGDESVKK